MAKKKVKQPKKDVWVRDTFGTNKKVDSFVKANGGNEWETAGFKRWMNYRTARYNQDADAARKATSNWQSGYQQSQKRLEERKREEISLKSSIKKSEEQRKKKRNQSLLPEIKKKKSSGFMDDVKAAGKAAYQFFNPFDDVKAGDAVKKYLNREPSDSMKGTARFTNRVVDSASMGAMSNLDKAVNKRDPYYNKERKIGEGGGTDMVATGLGYLVPGVGAVKAVRGLGIGAKAGTKGLQKALQLGKEGAIVGGAMSTAEVGIREALNGKDSSWKDNLAHIGLGVGTGALADPALYGIGKAVTGSLKSASNRSMAKMLDNPELAKKLGDGLKIAQSEHVSLKDFPNISKRPDTAALQDLIPTAGAPKPDLLPRIQKNDVSPLIPKIGKSLDELPAFKDENLSLLDRASYFSGKERPVSDFSFGKQSTEPIPQAKKFNVYGVEVPYDKVQDAPPEYWRGRYEQFAKYVNSNYDTNRLTPEALEDLWSQFAKYDEPVTLDELVDLAYSKQSRVLDANEVWDKMGNRPNATKQSKKILGIGKDATILNDVQPRPKPEPQPTITKTVYKPPQQPNLVPEVNQLKVTESTAKAPVQQDIQQPLNRPENLPYVEGERKHYSTLVNSEKATPEFIDGVKSLDRKLTHTVSDQDAVDFANGLIGRDIEEAFQFVKNADLKDKRHTVVGARLIDEFNKSGQWERAVDMADVLAKEGTKAGQKLQSFSVYNRLTAEGQLIRAQRRVNQINATLKPDKQVKLTEDMVANITDTADAIQRFTGQKETANNVMTIMDKIKNGKTPTDAELDQVRKFVGDARKFVSDLEPGAPPKPKKVKDVRTRDKVVQFMDKQEEIARKRLRELINRANSLPVDVFYDLSIIGASKVAKGTVKFADFAESMAKEFGEEIRPYMQQIYKKSVEAFNLQSESMTSQRLSEAEKIVNKALKDKNLSVDEADSIREFAKQVGAMSGDAKLEASMELQSVLQALERPTFGRQVATAQTIAQLLNPKTIVRNAIGNELFYRVEQINKLVATPVDIARSKILGKERTITFRTHNQGEYWKNFLVGGKAGWRGVNPMGLQTAYDLGPNSFKSKWNPLTHLEKALGATLRSFDHAAYMRAYNHTLGEIATLRAINMGLKGQAKKDAIAQFIREADDNMIALADQYGKYTTFQDNTVLSTGLQKAKRALNFNQDFGLGDMILKYPKTPGNLVMRALEYSPVGVLRSAYMLKNAVKGPETTREFYLGLSRAITGTVGFSIMGYALADAGILTSGGSSDYELASLERAAGKQPNSVNVSALKRFIESGFDLKASGTKKGDTFVSYDWAQPVSIAMALGAGVNQSQKESGELGTLDNAKGAFDSAANTVINQSVLKGLNDFLASYPSRTMSDRFTDVAKGLPSSFTPTLLNQVKQKNDNTSRTTYDNSFSAEMGNRVLNRIPGLDSKLPPSYDTLGNKRETYQGGTNSLFNVFLNPSFVSKYNPSPEADALLDYINETGDRRAAPRLADKKIEGTALTGEQYAELQRMIGTETKKGVQDLLPKLKDPEKKAEVGKDIYDLLNAAGKKGRGEIRRQIVTKDELAEAKAKYGLEANTIYERLEKGWTLNRALTTPN